MKVRAILSIKDKIRMLVYGACWSGHKVIGSSCLISLFLSKMTPLWYSI